MNAFASNGLGPLPLTFQIDAPLYEVQPILALALLGADEVWNQRSLAHAAAWQWEQEDSPTPTVIQLRLAEQSRKSVLRIEGPALTPALKATVEEVLVTLRHHKFEVVPVVAEAEVESSVALFIAPQKEPYLTLAPQLAGVVERYGLHLNYPAVEGMAASHLRRAVQRADLVIGAWGTLPGRAALYQSWAQERPVLALVRVPSVAADWLGPLVDYTQEPGQFLAALDEALGKKLKLTLLPSAPAAPQLPPTLPVVEEPTPPPWLQDALPASPPFRPRKVSPRQNPAYPALAVLPPPIPLPLPLSSSLSPVQEAERRRIYRRVALHRRAPLEQRFHAARVLHESGDNEGAAQALGALVVAKGAGDLADDALTLLGDLGPDARSVLWYLDALTDDPARAVAIARQMARAGDEQTALFRLERLVQNTDPAVRFPALDAIAATGVLAAPHLATLAQEARDPRVRLKVASWLLARGEAQEIFRYTLVELTEQSQQPELAREAVELLGQSPDEAVTEALWEIAQSSPNAEARLAAAEELHRRGNAAGARVVLLKLAQGTDDLAAGAALDILVNVSDKVTVDTERLMNIATLKTIRLRAAKLLGQPHQPEAIQQAAARVLLALDRPRAAVPILGRLARLADKNHIEIRRWAAQQLALVGEEALDELRRTFARVDDPIAGQYLAEGVLSLSGVAEDRRQAAIWLAEHSNLPRAVEVLGDLALSARISGSDAVRATNDLSHYATTWAGAARTLATLVGESPHPAVRARALDLLLREYPSELPLALLVDLAVTGAIGAADRSPVMEQLTVLARPAASRIATRLTDEKTDTDRRWLLLQLMNELPESAATPALLQLSARAPQNRIRYVAAQQLIARGQPQAGYAALATLAINEPEARLREMALYELAQGLPDTESLFHAIIERTRFEDTFHLAREVLFHRHSLLSSTVRWMDDLMALWNDWVASLPLGWFDRLVSRGRAPDAGREKAGRNGS